MSGRERVFVEKTSVGYERYYIKYLSYGEESHGYVDESIVYVPAKGFERPITTGRITQDFSANGHSGIDVAAAKGTSVYAVTNVVHKSYVSTKVIEGTNYLVNYGNYISASYNGTQIIYGHLSSFTNGAANTTLPSHLGVYTIGVTTTLKATWTPSKGEKIGGVGSTGNSTGAHLHFETRKESQPSTKYDPFSYVVFPNIGY